MDAGTSGGLITSETDLRKFFIEGPAFGQRPYIIETMHSYTLPM